MDRDSVLAAALGAAVLAGCTPSSRPAPAPSATPSPAAADPDVEVLLDWANAEADRAAAYGALLRGAPALRPLRDNHRARYAAVAEHLTARGADVPAAGPEGPAVRGSLTRAVALMATAERRLAATYLAALSRVSDPALVLLGAELAAGARQHAAVLSLVRVP